MRMSTPFAAAAILCLAAPATAPADPLPDGYTVVARGLEGVDNLALAPDGSLYATLERADGKGRVVHLAAGRLTTVLSDLDRPDGLLLSQGRLYVTEEVPDGRVLEVDPATGEVRTLVKLNKPEGIDRLADGSLAASEDVPDGRVVRIGDDGALTVLADKLDRPEGIAVGQDGTLYVCETQTGKVLALTAKGRTEVVRGLHEPDQVEVASTGALWITEDRDPGRLIRFYGGQTTVMAEGLASPQGIALGTDGTVYVAEQGANRILAFPPDLLTGRGAP